jgi:hypothetical protein
MPAARRFREKGGKVREIPVRHDLDADLGGGALNDAMFDAADGSEGVERARVPRHQAVEEVAQRRQRLVLVGAEPSSWPTYSPTKPGAIWRSSTPCCSHQARKRVTERP